MRWILENFPVLFAIGGIIAAWLNMRQRKGDESKEPPPTRQGDGDNGDLFDPFAEMRRIQEEIRRTSEARKRAADSPQLAPDRMPRPSDESPVEPALQRTSLPPPLPTSVEAAVFASEEVERQKVLAEEFERIEVRKREARARAQRAFDVSPVPSLPFVDGDLRDPAALKRAIVLREILGAPVALR